MERIKSDDRIIVLCEDIDEISVKTVIEKIEEINAKDDDWFTEFQILGLPGKREDVVPPIRLILSTFGGCVNTGLGLYDIIKHSKTPIRIECNGKIMSMGILIMLASKERYCYPHTTFMIHQLSYGEYGNLQEHEEYMKQMKRLDNVVFDIITENSNIPYEKLLEVCEKKQDWYMSAEEAEEYGLIKII